MRTNRARRVYLLTLALITIGISGCTEVMRTTEWPSNTNGATAESVPAGIVKVDSNGNAVTDNGAYPQQSQLDYYPPQAVIRISVTSSNGDWTVTAAPVYSADCTKKCSVDDIENIAFDDDTINADDGNMLLQTVSSVTTDETANTIGSLISAAGNFLVFGASLNPVTFSASAQTYSSYHNDIDPFNLPPGNKLHLSMHARATTPPPGGSSSQAPDTDFTITFIPHFPQVNVVNPTDATRVKPDKDGAYHYNGIVVRKPVPVEVRVTNGDQVQTTTVIVPDKRINYLFPINRRYTVTTSTKIGLTNGMITSIERNKPSLLAGIFGIPKSILSALAPIPVQVKQAQTNILQAEDNGLKAQADLQKGQ